MTATVPIAVQLYSLREQAGIDFEAVLRSVGSMGYVGVELAGFNGLTPARLSQVLADNDLVVASAHVGSLDADALHTALDDIQAVGCNTAVAAFLPPASFESLDAVRSSAAALASACEIANSRGVSFGYHNHWWEFENIFDGKAAWSHLFALTTPALFAELDVYWATVGRTDPCDAIAELGERVRLLHVKDGPADDPKSAMVAVGQGSIDIARILGSAPAATWHIVELDRCDTDMALAIEASYQHLVGSGLSRGRG